MSENKLSAYFVASLVGKDKYGDSYQQIADIVRKYGYEVYDDVNTISLQDAINRSPEEIEEYWKQTAARNIDKSDIFIAEITEKSTAIGVEIGMAVSEYKPTLLLRRDTNKTPLSAPFIALGSRLTVKTYNPKNLEKKINSWLQRVDEGIVAKYMNIGFSEFDDRVVEYIKEKYKMKSFALAIRQIVRGQIDVRKEIEELKKNN